MKRITAAIVAALAIGVLVGHNTNIYAGRVNGGITVGSVGWEIWGDPGFFTCNRDGGC